MGVGTGTFVRALAAAAVSIVVSVPAGACSRDDCGNSSDRARGPVMAAQMPGNADSASRLARGTCDESCDPSEPTPTPSPTATTTARATGAAAPTAPRAVPSSSGSVSSPVASPSPRVVMRTRVERVPFPVTVVEERTAVTLSIAIGLLGAAATSSLLTVASRRRRYRNDAVAGAAYRGLVQRFIANLSHELYTPLTPVKGYASMLRKHPMPADRVRKVADDMIAASDRLERVIDQIVSLAEIQRGAVEARGTRIDVRALIDETVGDLRADRLHPISVSIAGGVPPVEASERMLRAALRALVDNAVKFSPDGGPITIRAHARDGMLAITVRDRGIGMSRSQLRVAFDAFRQGDGSETRAFGGLGIGLALADRIARAHGGRLVASSRRGHGSAFTLAIPLVPARDALHRAS